MTIFAGAIVFTALLGISFWTGAIVIVVATGIYTVFGGFKAVVYTDLIQMFVLVGGSIILTCWVERVRWRRRIGNSYYS